MADCVEITCPYCGERFGLEVDTGGGPVQLYTADCEICCKPIAIRIEIAGNGEVSATAHAESE
jgi:transcription elongation factor Elf1